MPRANLPALSVTAPMPLLAPVVPQHYINPGLSLNQVFAILWAHRKTSLYIAIAFSSLVAAAVLMMPKSYESTATLMVDYEVNDPLGGKEFPIGLLGSYMSTQIELMRSDEVLMPLVDRLKLTENRTYTKGYSGDPAKLRQWIGKAIGKKLLIEQGRYGSQLIYVTYSAGTPVNASLIANSVADIYMEQQYQRVTGPASDRSKRYMVQLDELKLRAAQAQDNLTDFRQRSGLLDSDTKIDIDMERLSTLQQRLIEAQNARRVAESRATENQSVAQQVLSSSLIQSLKAQLAVQTSRMAELKATLGPSHPQMIELHSQIDATRSSLAAEVGSYSSGASSDLSATRQLESKLQEAVDQQHARVLEIHRLQDEGAKYELDLQSAQSVYKRALDSYDQVMFVSTGHYTNTSFVSRAEPPLRAAKPKTVLDLSAGAIVGLLLGLLVPLCRDLLNRRVRCRDDLERDHNIPVLVEFNSPSMRRAIS